MKKVSEAVKKRYVSDSEKKTIDEVLQGDDQTKTCASTSRCASETNDTTPRLQQETMEGNDGYVDIIIGDPLTSFSNLNNAG